jgi:hypothetical protein
MSIEMSTPVFTPAQNRVLYQGLRLIKGSTRQQLACQSVTLRALTSTGFALSQKAGYLDCLELFYKNSLMQHDVKVMNEESLLALWMDNEPTATSDYVIYRFRKMWAAVHLPDNMVLYCRPSTYMHREIPHSPCKERRGVSYQFQQDGHWLGQGSVGSYEHFCDEILPAAQTDLGYLRRVALA